MPGGKSLAEERSKSLMTGLEPSPGPATEPSERNAAPAVVAAAAVAVVVASVVAAFAAF